MAFTKSGNSESKQMSAVENATHYVRQMAMLEARGWGDQYNALRRIAHRSKLRLNALVHLHKGKAKKLDTDLFFNIRQAYLDLCEQQIAKLQQQIEKERALGTDDDLEGLGNEAALLAARIAARKAK